MQKGVVKNWFDDKGFGFIKVDGGGEDVFVHSSGLKEPVRKGDEVSFEVEQGKKGLNAVNVRKA